MDLEHAPLKPLARLNPRGPAKPPASDPAAADLKPRNPQDYGGIDSEEPPAMRQSVLGLSVNKRSADESEESPGGGISLGAPPLSRPGEKHDVPAVYKLRVAPDRVQVAQRYGATPETEAAVQAALKWVSEAQASDGRWSARQHGGGLELKTDGRDRLGAGLEADTGMTGLALLALLASGHTHRDGLYHQNVQHGLEFLLRSQTREGNLGGAGSVYERMYCHGIAAFALSEALGMTSDERLRDPVRRALAFTVAAQNPKTGGWRYQPGDPGDTSQLGWQYMALKSGELAGIPIADSTREGIFKFLQSVATGRAGGLALYRALPKERPTRVMSAEAIACWQLLGMSRDHPAGREAADFIVEELPGGGPNNVYYWYYGTLALYQLQGEPWARWNEALRSTLLASQRKDGPLAGSWDPDAVWGGYGGRVYSTAISALCLEVYYRFLPLYRQASMPAASPAGKGER
jgi:hypothetical protein